MVKKFLTAVILLVLLTSCGEKAPKRTHIPVLKEKLYALQTAVMDKNRAAIDSLLSPKILEKNESSDSLLNLVYGSDGTFAFEAFGNADIFYTENNARINCFIMDSTKTDNRPLEINLVHEHDMWLVSSFESKEDIPNYDTEFTE